MSRLEQTSEDIATTLLYQFRHVIDGHIASWNSGHEADHYIPFNCAVVQRVHEYVITELHVTAQGIRDPHNRPVSSYICDMLISRLYAQVSPMLGDTRPAQLKSVLKLIEMIDQGHRELTVRQLWAKFAGIPIS